jgi:hypothetical protein
VKESERSKYSSRPKIVDEKEEDKNMDIQDIEIEIDDVQKIPLSQRKEEEKNRKPDKIIEVDFEALKEAK